jgi:hypothetical protein
MGHASVAALVLVIRMSGESTMDPALMERARGRAEAILMEAGIEVAWRSCGEAIEDVMCHGAPATNQIVVRLLPGRPPIGEHACGAALVPSRAAGHFASVFVDCVRSAASELRVAEDVVLGCTLVHEIGHLLMGVNSHGSQGLMQAQPRPIDWERAVHNGLKFTESETRKLQQALKRRATLSPEF